MHFCMRNRLRVGNSCLTHSHREKFPEVISEPEASISKNVLCLPTKMKTASGHINRGWA